MDFNKDYYNILAIPSTASKEEIKAAYRRLVKLYHPDRNQGSELSEERIKDINEAYEVLYNDITRHAYHEYCKEKEELEKKEKPHPTQPTQDIPRGNKHTYVRTHTRTKEMRTYVKGTIIIKFWGELVREEGNYGVELETDYQIHPTDVIVTILETDIHPLDKAPTAFQQCYKESELFTTPLRKPINCVITTSGAEEHYSLDLLDIRVKNPTITNITKHEGDNLGTLTGELYAYVNRFITEEYEVAESECFGDTGKVEFKNEEGQRFMRRESYNNDCTTTWGAWQPVGQHRGGGATTKTGQRKQPYPSNSNYWQTKPTTTFSSEPEGCLQYWWLVPLVFLAIGFPPLGAGLIIVIAFVAVFHLLSFFITRAQFVLPVLALLFLASIVFAISKSGSKPIHTSRNSSPSQNSVSESQTLIRKRNASQEIDDSTQVGKMLADTLINHFVRWQDYDSLLYEANLSISAADLRSSIQAHQKSGDLPITNLQQVYRYFENEDSTKLKYIYAVFDSIRISKNLNEQQFANMIVSCIQSLPYYLVLDQSCSDKAYADDEFISSYLNACDRDCCIGNVLYGVASPAEFIGNLKGDCDTRALLLYIILKHFRYNVALLTSNYYKHAVIAVHFEREQPNGLSLSIRNKNYYLWETTSTQLKAGVIAPAVQNLTYWEVSLLHENN
jgi:hypothetical protein